MEILVKDTLVKGYDKKIVQKHEFTDSEAESVFNQLMEKVQ